MKHFVKTFIPELVLARRRMELCGKALAAFGVILRIRDEYFDLEHEGRVLRVSRRHEVYLPYVARNFSYFFDSVIPVLPDGPPLVDMSEPRYHRLAGFSDLPLLFPSLTEPFETTQEYLDFAELQEGQTVLDLGAYAAVTSIVFAAKVGATGCVFAFEADAETYRCAQENLRLAKRYLGLDNINLISKAVWSHGDGILFSEERAMGSGAVAITGGGRGRERVVPSTTLQAFCLAGGLPQVDFVKMDIEGAEVEVLRHSAGWLAAQKTKLVVEPHRVNGVMSTEICRAALEAAGYSVILRGQGGDNAPLILATPD